MQTEQLVLFAGVARISVWVGELDALIRVGVPFSINKYAAYKAVSTKQLTTDIKSVELIADDVFHNFILLLILVVVK